MPDREVAIFAAVKTEAEMKTFTRITVDPDQMGGLPCIRSLRIPVANVVGMGAVPLACARVMSL